MPRMYYFPFWAYNKSPASSISISGSLSFGLSSFCCVSVWHSFISCRHVHCIASVLWVASGSSYSFPLSVSCSGAPSRVRDVP